MRTTTGILTVIGAAFAIIGLTAVRASAVSPVIDVPEPGMLTTFASTIVAGIIGYRWIRRR